MTFSILGTFGRAMIDGKSWSGTRQIWSIFRTGLRALVSGKWSFFGRSEIRRRRPVFPDPLKLVF